MSPLHNSLFSMLTLSKVHGFILVRLEWWIIVVTKVGTVMIDEEQAPVHPGANLLQSQPSQANKKVDNLV